MLPPTLQALKDQARSAADEARSVADEEAEASWQLLLAVAQESLGPLWQFVTNKTSRPHRFPAQGVGFGGPHHAFEIAIPGHRMIYAPFDGREKTWWRSYYPGGSNTTDVDHGRQNWMVDAQPGPNTLPTYFQTLGAAMVAAEMRAARC